MDPLERSELIAAIARDASSSEDLETILRRSLDRLHKVIDFKGGSIAFLGEDGTLAIAVVAGIIDEAALAVRAMPGQGIVGSVFSTGRSFRSGDLDRETRVPPANRGVGTNRLLRSILCVPLTSRAEVFGTLEIDSAEPDAFDAADQELVETIGGVLGGLVRLARLVERERAVVAARDDLFAAVAHDLRNPLTVIHGQAQRLLRRHGSDSDTPMVEAILGQGVRLEHLIANLLDVARARSGNPIPAARRGSELDSIVERAARDALGPERGARLAFDLTPVQAELDPRRVEQIVTNLVENADKYAPDGPIEVRVRADALEAVIEISDHGPGVSAIEREQIWRRWDRGNREGGRGAGLGLYIVRLAAEAHGGSASVGARLDGGSGATFRIRFPLREPDVAAARQDAPQGPAAS